MSDDHRNPPCLFKRRLALKTLGGSALASGLPDKLPHQWQRPFVNASALPAHAQMTLPAVTTTLLTAVPVSVDNNGSVCVIQPEVLSNWTFQLTTITLYHTAGLERMALTGNHDLLQQEYCNIGTPAAIPGNNALGDDFEGVGYATIRKYDGYTIAMYHQTNRYPDNWIIYHEETGRWQRFDLGKAGRYHSGNITERCNSSQVCTA